MQQILIMEINKGEKMDIKKAIAKKEFNIIGGEKPKVTKFWDYKDEKNIDILCCQDRPFEGVSTYATIGLTDVNIGLFSDDKRLSIEIIGACDAREIEFPNILASVAFEIDENQEGGYGYIISDVIKQYMSESELEHIYLTSPLLWEGFDTVEFEDRKVAWLLMIPISEKEKEYAIEYGIDALEEKFEEFDIDIFNLKRKSIL